MSLAAKKVKLCKSCGESFSPWATTQKCCGVQCATQFAKSETQKIKKSEFQSARRKLLDTDRRHWIAKAQKACNAYIRARDKSLACISCGALTSKQWDAGHYRPAGGHSLLRFDEVNINKQCCRCNDGSKLSGNLTMYRIGLLVKVGMAEVERLETSNETKRWSIDDLKEIERKYKQKLKELK